MEHFRLRKYRGPETWARVREAYLAGEPAASVARRFDVTVANLRKKASLEHWTRAAHAAETDLRPIRGEPDTPPPPLERTGEVAPEPAVAPNVAVARGLARASAALARGDAAGAVALTRAAEGLARATGHDPAAPPPPEALDDDEDAAREAAARAAWEGVNVRVEERAGVLALQLLADRRGGPAIHSGFALHWRAAHLGPVAGAPPRAAPPPPRLGRHVLARGRDPAPAGRDPRQYVRRVPAGDPHQGGAADEREPVGRQAGLFMRAEEG